MCDYVDERQAHKFSKRVVDPNVELIWTDEAGIYRNLDKLRIPARNGRSQSGRIRARRGWNEEHRQLLEHIEARHHRHVPQGFGQVPADVSGEISIPVQSAPRSRHSQESASRMLTRPRCRLRSALRHARGIIGAWVSCSRRARVYFGSAANKAKPVSLHPLTFHEALKALVKAKPQPTPAKLKSVKKKQAR